MPSFIIKHGCCYIPPVESNPDLAQQVYANPDFRRGSPSDALCGAVKSNPEFSTPRKVQRVPSRNLDDDQKAAQKLQAKVEQCRKPDGIALSKVSSGTLPGKEVTRIENSQANASFVTVYGRTVDCDKCDSAVSDCSVYRPTTIDILNDRLSNSEKFLDCLSICFWKCSAWCQRVD